MVIITESGQLIAPLCTLSGCIVLAAPSVFFFWGGSGGWKGIPPRQSAGVKHTP